MAVDWKRHIVSDPEILRGKPRLMGTRVPDIARAQGLDAILLSLNSDFTDIVTYPPKNYKGISRYRCEIIQKSFLNCWPV